jgi:hypothetical protein
MFLIIFILMSTLVVAQSYNVSQIFKGAIIEGDGVCSPGERADSADCKFHFDFTNGGDFAKILIAFLVLIFIYLIWRNNK